MKVALLSDCYPPRTGGIESQVGDLAAQLAAAGHEVEVFTATAGGAGTEEVRVHRLSTPLSMGLPVNPEILVGALVPFVAAGVWLGLRRMHHKLHAH